MGVPTHELSRLTKYSDDRGCSAGVFTGVFGAGESPRRPATENDCHRILSPPVGRLRNEILALRSARQGFAIPAQDQGGMVMDLTASRMPEGEPLGSADPADQEKGLTSLAGSSESDRVAVSCAFCHGIGTDPFGIMSWLSTCCVCKGRGIVQVQAPYARCAHCGGTGAIKRLTCTACGGKGRVPLPACPTVVCPLCQGTGNDRSEWAIPCPKCRGCAWLPV